jgi:hypothetical protein
MSDFEKWKGKTVVSKSLLLGSFCDIEVAFIRIFLWYWSRFYERLQGKYGWALGAGARDGQWERNVARTTPRGAIQVFCGRDSESLPTFFYCSLRNKLFGLVRKKFMNFHRRGSCSEQNNCHSIRIRLSSFINVWRLRSHWKQALGLLSQDEGVLHWASWPHASVMCTLVSLPHNTTLTLRNRAF